MMPVLPKLPHNQARQVAQLAQSKQKAQARRHSAPRLLHDGRRSRRAAVHPATPSRQHPIAEPTRKLDAGPKQPRPRRRAGGANPPAQSGTATRCGRWLGPSAAARSADPVLGVAPADLGTDSGEAIELRSTAQRLPPGSARACSANEGDAAQTAVGAQPAGCEVERAPCIELREGLGGGKDSAASAAGGACPRASARREERMLELASAARLACEVATPSSAAE
eukprot:SAG11_NODE_9672_length_890_cov_2.204804_1_plen_223_part_10